MEQNTQLGWRQNREVETSHHRQFYIGGAWADPATPILGDVENPSTGEVFAQICLGSVADVDKAVTAAKRAFTTFGCTSVAERVDLLHRVVDAYVRRSSDLALVLSQEMGAPLAFARNQQVGIGLAHLQQMIKTLETFEWQRANGDSLVIREPIGVVGLITPWNWPLNQITCKVAPALAAGCTMVLKPSEIAPLNAIIFAEIMDAAGIPPGVFNMVNGEGGIVGEAMSAHRDIDMMSFTGSTRAGILVARAAAGTVKRVHQELGGKSANILFGDTDFAVAVTAGANGCFSNSGQSCDAPTRMFVPRARQDEAAHHAKAAAERHVVGPADGAGTTLGPVVSRLQYDKIQDLIRSGIAEGACLVTGGPGHPDGLHEGYFVRPTVFADVTQAMRIAREEVFGPVLSILPYDTEDEAVEAANDTPFGLAAYLQTPDLDKARRVARRLRAGTIYINHPAWDASLPFGGYKQSGNGREYGEYGLADFLEIKGVAGYGTG